MSASRLFNYICLVIVQSLSAMHMRQLAQRLAVHNDLDLRVSVENIGSFICFTRRLWRDITLMQDIHSSFTTDAPPDTLPPSVLLFLSDSLGQAVEDLKLLWDILKHDIWKEKGLDSSNRDDELYKVYGIRYGIGTWHTILSRLQAHCIH